MDSSQLVSRFESTAPGQISSIRVANIVNILISVLLVLLHLAGVQTSSTFDMGVLISLLVLFGIPHGSIDHLIHARVRQSQGRSASSRQFYAVYLGLMAFYALLWYLLPIPSLSLFLLISAFHFGQSQLYHIAIPEKHWFKRILYLNWGLFIISGLFYFHFEYTVALLNTLPAVALQSAEGWMRAVVLVWAVTGLVSVLSLAGLFLTGLIGRATCWFELGALVVLQCVFWLSSPLLSFALYFGCWHSFKTLVVEYQMLKQHTAHLSVKSFVRSLLPYSLLSLLGIAFILLLGHVFRQEISIYMLFLISISVLTLPHFYFLDTMYQKIPDR